MIRQAPTLGLRVCGMQITHAKVAKVAEVFQGGKRDILSVLGVMFGLAHAKDAKGVKVGEKKKLKRTEPFLRSGGLI